MSEEMYWNEEDSEEIICPYCSKRYEPSYEDTYIGHVSIDCYEEGKEQEAVCDVCGKKFTIIPYMSNWKYRTETIDGEITQEEWERHFE